MQKRGNRLSQGEIYGFLTVVREVEGKYFPYLCLCVCGKERIVLKQNLKNGHTVSCGCKKGFLQIRHNHSGSGKTPTPEYRTWKSMKRRCNNPKDDNYHHYGGRGVKVCKRWNDSFESFLRDMGPRPKGTSLDRFPDKDGDYGPQNCRWATQKEQMNNVRSNIMIEYNGVSRSQSDWNKILGRGSGWITYHLKKGKTIKWIMDRANALNGNDEMQ